MHSLLQYQAKLVSNFSPYSEMVKAGDLQVEEVVIGQFGSNLYFSSFKDVLNDLRCVNTFNVLYNDISNITLHNYEYFDYWKVVLFLFLLIINTFNDL